MHAFWRNYTTRRAYAFPLSKTAFTCDTRHAQVESPDAFDLATLQKVLHQHRTMFPGMRPAHFTTLILLLLMWRSGFTARYTANWTSLDTRPLPQWYDDAKIGIFIHWGVFSVPSFGKYSEWLWYWWKSGSQPSDVEFMRKNYPPGFKYADFAHDFRAEFFDPDTWADLFKASGARYGHKVSSC